MKKLCSLCLLCSLFFSCSPAKVNYIGSKYSPTQNVDVFVDEAAIKRPFDIVGKGYFQVTPFSMNKQEKLQEKAIEKAKKIGADAIFYKEVYIPTPGTQINSYSQSDSLNKSLVARTSTAITPTYGYFHKELLFLRYR